MAYIYKISNDINNKVYIGKTNQTIKERWHQHCSDSKDRVLYEKRPLYSAMNKYGIEHFKIEEIERLANRKVAQTKNQKDNEVIKEVMLEILAGLDEAVTVTDFIKADERMADYSNQKVSALMKQLVDAGKVTKATEKKKSYFKLAD